MIRKGSPVYPWPSQRSPADNWKRMALRLHNMTEWVDPNQNEWKDIAQTTANVYDKADDIPDEQSDLFKVTVNESASESSSEDEISTQKSSAGALHPHPDELFSSSEESDDSSDINVGPFKR